MNFHRKNATFYENKNLAQSDGYLCTPSWITTIALKRWKKLCQQLFPLEYLFGWLWMTFRKWKRKIIFPAFSLTTRQRSSRYLELMFLLMTRLKCRSNKLSYDDISLSVEVEAFQWNVCRLNSSLRVVNWAEWVNIFRTRCKRPHIFLSCKRFWFHSHYSSSSYNLLCDTSC